VARGLELKTPEHSQQIMLFPNLESSARVPFGHKARVLCAFFYLKPGGKLPTVPCARGGALEKSTSQDIGKIGVADDFNCATMVD
jgi:hypothetical protein